MPKGHPSPPPPRSLLGDLGSVWTRRSQIWRLVSRRDKLGFGASVLTMAFVAQLETIMPVLLGKFIDSRLRKWPDVPTPSSCG